MRSAEENELTRKVVQACAGCKHGKARLVCHRKNCHNKQVRGWLKKLKTLTSHAPHKHRIS